MTDTGRRAGQTAAPDRSYSGANPSGWVVWIQFAGMMMIIGGSFHAISGLVALFKDDYYVVGSSGLVITVDYTLWGWVHLLVGLLVFATGCGALAGRTWARMVGVVLAVMSAVVNMLFLAAYPVWSVIIITLDVIVIYALIVHGREAART